MSQPWFWIHIIPRLNVERTGPTPSRYPVLGFHKEPNYTRQVIQEGMIRLVDELGATLLLIDDGTSIHAVKQEQTVRCQEPNRTCPVCATGRNGDAADYASDAAEVARA